MTDCLFCKIASKEIPSDIIFEDDICIAFNDIAPLAPVHFLVVPKNHIGNISDVSKENSAVVSHIFEVISYLAKNDPKLVNGFRVVSNCGQDAGQSVQHLHFHVLGGTKLEDKMG